MAGQQDKAKTSGTRRIKYMGSSDVRGLNKTDHFGGRLPDGLGVDLEFNESNGWTQEVDLDPEVLDLLLGERERDGTGTFFNAFADVTGKKVVPDSEFQKRWRPRGLPDGRKAQAVLDDVGAGAVVTSELGAGATGSTVSGGSGTGGAT